MVSRSSQIQFLSQLNEGMDLLPDSDSEQSQKLPIPRPHPIPVTSSTACSTDNDSVKQVESFSTLSYPAIPIPSFNSQITSNDDNTCSQNNSSLVAEYRRVSIPMDDEKSQPLSNSFTSPSSPHLTHMDYPQKRASEDVDSSQVLATSIPSQHQTNSSSPLPSIPTHRDRIKIQKGNRSVKPSFHPYHQQHHQQQQQQKKRQRHQKHHHSNVFSKDALEDEEKRYATLIRRLDGYSLTVDIIRQQFCMFKTISVK